MRRTSRALPALNFVMRLFQHRADPDTAYDRLLARRGIDAASDPFFHQEMRFLLHHVAQVPELSPVGWFSFYSDIEARIGNRARVLALHQTHPEIGEQVIKAPIIVIGLPRTATTLAHHVFAGAPEARGPRLWEWSHTDLERDEDEQHRVIASVEADMRMVARLAPAMRIIHLPDARLPDECAYLLPHGEQHLARAPMPGYESWLSSEHDFGPDYRYLKQALQVLQHGRPKRRWVLKCPTHLGRLPLLLREFPDAMFVWTHRDPIEVTGSICSLVETSRAMHLRRMGTGERHDVGRMALETMSGLNEQARKDRLQIPPAQIVDVPYTRLTTAPLASIEVLHTRLGLAWTRAEAARVQTLIDAGPGTAHRYSLDRYGIEPADIDHAFGDYPRLVAGLRDIT